MKKALVILFLFLLLGCTRAAPEYTPANLSDVLTRPEVYSGKNIIVEGIVVSQAVECRSDKVYECTLRVILSPLYAKNFNPRIELANSDFIPYRCSHVNYSGNCQGFKDQQFYSMKGKIGPEKEEYLFYVDSFTPAQVPERSDTIITQLIEVEGGSFEKFAGYYEGNLKLKNIKTNEEHTIFACTKDWSWVKKDACYKFSPSDIEENVESHKLSMELSGCYIGSLKQTECK